MRIDQLVDGGPFPRPYVIALVTAADEDSVGARNDREQPRILGGLPVMNDQRLDRCHATDIAENVFLQAGPVTGAQHDDVAAAGPLHKPAKGLDRPIAAAHQREAGGNRARSGRIDVALHIMLISRAAPVGRRDGLPGEGSGCKE